MGVYSDPDAGPVTSSAKKEQRGHVSSSVSCGGGGPLLKNPFGKLLKCKFLGSIQMFCIQISTGRPQEHALSLSSFGRVWHTLQFVWSPLMRLWCEKLPVQAPSLTSTPLCLPLFHSRVWLTHSRQDEQWGFVRGVSNGFIQIIKISYN